MPNDFSIHLARDDKQQVLPLPLVTDGGRAGVPPFCCFAVGGVAAAGFEPRVGALFTAGSTSAVAFGHLFQQPRQENYRTWGMWFDLGGNPWRGSFDLVFYRLLPPTRPRTPPQLDELGRETSVSFIMYAERKIKHKYAVFVAYPAGGTVNASGFAAYGTFTNPDTQLLRAELLNEDATATVQTNNAPYSNGYGFWSAGFSGLTNGTKYCLRGVGNAASSNPTAPFTAQG